MNGGASVEDFYQPSQDLHLVLIDLLKLIYEGSVEDFQSANEYNMTSSTNILIIGNKNLSIDPNTMLPEISKVSVCIREREHQEENNISTSFSLEQRYTVKKKTEVMAISNKSENEISSSSIIPTDQRNLTGTNIINVSDKEMDLIPKIEEISENHLAMIKSQNNPKGLLEVINSSPKRNNGQILNYDDFQIVDYGIGFVNVCGRPTKGAAKIPRKKMRSVELRILNPLRSDAQPPSPTRRGHKTTTPALAPSGGI